MSERMRSSVGMAERGEDELHDLTIASASSWRPGIRESKRTKARLYEPSLLAGCTKDEEAPTRQSRPSPTCNADLSDPKCEDVPFVSAEDGLGRLKH
jgi:hypothetical protein